MTVYFVERVINKFNSTIDVNNTDVKYLAKRIQKMEQIRDFMYYYGIDGTFEHECEMREVSLQLATKLLDETKKVKIYVDEVTKDAFNDYLKISTATLKFSEEHDTDFVEFLTFK